MSTAHIASIHFHPVHADRKQFGFGCYDIPAVPLGDKPFILEVADKVQVERGPYIHSTDKKKRSITRFPATGQEIARDLVDTWAAKGLGMEPSCRPGIWVVRESMPVLWDKDNIDEGGKVVNPKGSHMTDAEGTGIWREATPEERKAMWDEDHAASVAADVAYAEMLIANVNAMDERLWAKFISPVSKAAAAHYKIATSWNTKAGALQRVACPHCKEQVMKGAVRCKHCAQIIDPEAAALLDARQENSMLKAKKIQESQAKATQAA